MPAPHPGGTSSRADSSRFEPGRAAAVLHGPRAAPIMGWAYPIDGGAGRELSETFDYLIIGAGSAGCVVANRLALASGATLCVLEAGPRDIHPFIHIPAGFMKTVADPSINWLYETLPGEGTAGRRIPQPRGKTLGGSGSINGHVYNRGQRLDYDTWAQMGNRGWGYREVLPYFKRSERRIGAGDGRFRGRDGPFTVTELDWKHPLVDAFIEGALSLGIPRNLDYNGASHEGVALAQRSIYRGRRVSPARAFLHPAMRRGNLDVRTGAHVEGILFEGRRAVGARYLRGGRSLEVRAAREVILCAGVFNSPQILHRSGVGPPALLADLGVPVVRALSGVGENLRDHCYVALVARVKGVDTINERARGLRLAREVLRYAIDRGGLLSLQPTLVYLSWHSDESVRNNDLQVTFTPASYGETYESGLDREPGMTFGGWSHRTESRGYVRASSPDPLAPPLIQPNYLADEMDQRGMLAALRLARRILRSEPLSPYCDGEKTPGEEVTGDDELLAYGRESCSSCYHPMGTCRMGPGGDPGAVVDAELRVHGVEGLRVADASVMPTMPSGNLNAPTLMIAEKAADMILGRSPLPPAELDDPPAS